MNLFGNNGSSDCYVHDWVRAALSGAVLHGDNVAITTPTGYIAFLKSPVALSQVTLNYPDVLGMEKIRRKKVISKTTRTLLKIRYTWNSKNREINLGHTVAILNDRLWIVGSRNLGDTPSIFSMLDTVQLNFDIGFSV